MSSALLLLTTTWLAGADAPIIVQTSGTCNCGHVEHKSHGCNHHGCDHCEWGKPSLRDRIRSYFKSDDCCCEEDTCNKKCDDKCEHLTAFERWRSKHRSKKCCDVCQGFYHKTLVGACNADCPKDNPCCGHGCSDCDDCCDGGKMGWFSRLFSGGEPFPLRNSYNPHRPANVYGWDYVGPIERQVAPHANAASPKMMAPADGLKVMPSAPETIPAPESLTKKVESAPTITIPTLQRLPVSEPLLKSPYATKIAD